MQKITFYERQTIEAKLRQRRSQRRISASISIHERPVAVAAKARVGHWESDTAVCRKQQRVLATQSERASQLLRLHQVADRSAAETTLARRDIITSLPHDVFRTMTCDNGGAGAGHLDLIMAHQYLGQLVTGSGVEGKSGDSRVRDAIFGNVGTVVCFRVGVDDAELLAKQLDPGVTEQDLMNIEKYHAYVRLMVDNAAAPAFAMRTPPPVAGDAQVAAAIRKLSRLKHGRPQRAVEDEIYAILELGRTAAPPAPAPKPL